MTSRNNSASAFDVAVIGAGVFGAWATYELSRNGLKVALVDAHGPGNSRASSGGESRVIRMGYGTDEVYSRSALRSFERWREFISQIQRVKSDTGGSSLASFDGQLFQRAGVLWLAHPGDDYVLDTKDTLERIGVKYEELSRSELARRYPQIDFNEVSWGLLELDSGVLMARQLVHAVVKAAVNQGVTYLEEAIAPFPSDDSGPVRNDAGKGGKLEAITARGGLRIVADKFVFACGPWLPTIFPELLGELIHPTRQEVFFFGVPAGTLRFAPPAMPVWIDFHDLIYAIPDLEGRGFKIAIDRHGPPFDPEAGDRVASAEGLKAVREHLARRVPALRNAPVIETRVCQYENTSNGDFLIDRHPGFENVWLVGGGSGHGFKHGPVVGEYVAALITGEKVVLEPRFALAAKGRIEERAAY
jgi:sarcosine oxidase